MKIFEPVLVLSCGVLSLVVGISGSAAAQTNAARLRVVVPSLREGGSRDSLEGR